MSGWSPPSLSREWLLAIVLGYVLLLAYSFVIAQQILLGVWLGGSILSLYLLWRFLLAVEAIADALQRMADQGDP